MSTTIDIASAPQRKNLTMTDNTAQKASPSYRLPALDQDFLLGDSMRGVRLQLEYEKAEERLRAWVVRSTIVVFGSARALAPDPSAQILQLDERTNLSHWYEEARRFGRIASERGGALIARDGLRDNVIATGGGPGIMEAANRGAAEAGAPSIGFNIGCRMSRNPTATRRQTLRFSSITSP